MLQTLIYSYLFEKDKKPKRNGRSEISAKDMLEDIEKLPAYDCDVLRLAHEANWRALCSYTHTGYHAIVRQMTQEAIESKFSDEEICELLQFARAMGLLAALELATMANNESLAALVLSKIKEI